MTKLEMVKAMESCTLEMSFSTRQDCWSWSGLQIKKLYFSVLINKINYDFSIDLLVNFKAYKEFPINYFGQFQIFLLFV